MFDYSRLTGRATALLTRFGYQVPVTRPGSVTRVNGVEMVQPASAFTITGVKKDYNPFMIDGKLIQSGDVQFIATAEHEMKIGDLVELHGKRWRVEKPNPAEPAGTLLVYKMQLRAV